MADFSGSCPLPPYPGLIKPSPQHSAMLGVTILYPITITIFVLFFWFNKKDSVYLRKRKFRWVLFNAVTSLSIWGSTVVYDYVGSEMYPCWLLECLCYLCLALHNIPGTAIVVGYTYEVAALRLQQRAQQALLGDDRNSVTNNSTQDTSDIDVNPQANWRTFVAFLRVLFAKNRDQHVMLLSAKFTRTRYCLFFWTLIGIFPYVIAFLIRAGLNPQWRQCTGCDLQPIDLILLIVINTGAFLITAYSNTTRIKKRDSLRVVREWLLIWCWAALLLLIGYVLALIDPGEVYARGILNWRIFMIGSALASVYIQTVHQVFVARALKAKLIVASSINYQERLDDVLRDKILAGKLRAFLDSELSSEILQFIAEVDDFKRNYDKDGSHKKAKIIFDTFIRQTAHSEINISSAVRLKLTNRLLLGDLSVDIFDEAYSDIKQTLAVDGFARFLQAFMAQENRTATKSQGTWSLGHLSVSNKGRVSAKSVSDTMTPPENAGLLV